MTSDNDFWPARPADGSEGLDENRQVDDVEQVFDEEDVADEEQEVIIDADDRPVDLDDEERIAADEGAGEGADEYELEGDADRPD